MNGNYLVEQDYTPVNKKTPQAESINSAMALLTPADVIQIRQALSVLYSLSVNRELPHSQCVAADAIDALDKAQEVTYQVV